MRVNLPPILIELPPPARPELEVELVRRIRVRPIHLSLFVVPLLLLVAACAAGIALGRLA